jgi:prepilin-type N-terminal cleavage/methylation domain-containing protein
MKASTQHNRPHAPGTDHKRAVHQDLRQIPDSGPLRRRPAAGFTLIELMVTVAIAAILASIAYPSYRSYVIRGQLTSATTGLSAVSANMERYFQDNRTYLPANGANPPCKTAAQYGTFTVSCPSVLTATTYQVQAVGSSNTAGFKFFIDQQGNQSSTVSSPAPSGWTNCSIGWETKAGQCP